VTRAATPFDPARSWIAEQIRSRVIGDEPDVKAAEVMLTPGPRWFPEGSVIREVHADAAMFIGGLRALLLQSLHPLAMAGVAAHSDYRADPWGRLQRTADFLAATTYGPVPMAERAVEAVQRVHSRVAGVASDGRSYSANDPHLLRWVHVAEMDSFLAAHQRYGSRRLPPDDVDAYLADCALVAEKLGVIDAPRTRGELRRQLRDYRPELRGTREARESARFLLFEPPLPLAARAPYTVLAAAAVSLLPGWARWPLRLPLLPVSEAVLVKPAGAAVTHLIRWSLRAGASSRRP
jgi:uncharacterized protein (DUF2236 family)